MSRSIRLAVEASNERKQRICHYFLVLLPVPIIEKYFLSCIYSLLAAKGAGVLRNCVRAV